MNAPSVDQAQVADLFDRERRRFADDHPRSRDLSERGRRSMLNGVPMPFMTEWPAEFPVFVSRAQGAEVVDVDEHLYADLCLGDTGAMTGHAPEPTVNALLEQFRDGATHMLPTEDSIWVAE